MKFRRLLPSRFAANPKSSFHSLREPLPRATFLSEEGFSIYAKLSKKQFFQQILSKKQAATCIFRLSLFTRKKPQPLHSNHRSANQQTPNAPDRCAGSLYLTRNESRRDYAGVRNVDASPVPTYMISNTINPCQNKTFANFCVCAFTSVSLLSI